MTVTVTEFRASPTFDLVPVDLYRDIHKAIRAELFAVTTEAGRTDPGDAAARAAVADHVHRVVELLVAHAEHEDAHVQSAIAEHMPVVAARIMADHVALDARLGCLDASARDTAAAAPSDRRGRMHHLYLDLASFTSAYLEHQDVEERVVMPALPTALGLEPVVGIHQRIVGSIPPEQMAASLAIMIPAMNIDDRAELVGAMQANAPAEVFAGVWGLTRTVLGVEDRDALAARLGID
ncbi:MAG: hemerythrin domain-containing protein [Actinobacteria bacterium]|nr:hemerythrin domain-containing protein [Actinomycetota bacterium]